MGRALQFVFQIVLGRALDWTDAASGRACLTVEGALPTFPLL